MTYCKIDSGVSASESCDPKISGITDLRIAVRAAVASITTNKCSSPEGKVIEGVTMDGDADAKFYKFATKKDSLGFTSNWTYDPENDTIVFTETIEGNIKSMEAKAFCSLEALLSNEIVVLAKEAGDAGKWFMAGYNGELYLKEVNTDHGKKKTDPKNVIININGELDARFLFIDAGTAFDTAQLIATISE